MTMNRRRALACFLVAALGFGTALAAQQDKGLIAPKGRQLLEGDQFQAPPTPPPDSFRNLMKANDAITSVDAAAGGGDAAGAAGPVGAQTTFRGTLSTFLGETPDFEAALKDTAVLKANFAQIEEFFATTVKSPEAAAHAKAGSRAILDLEAALKDKERVKAMNAQIGVVNTCRQCHIGHRVLVITQPLQFSIIR